QRHSPLSRNPDLCAPCQNFARTLSQRVGKSDYCQCRRNLNRLPSSSLTEFGSSEMRKSFLLVWAASLLLTLSACGGGSGGGDGQPQSSRSSVISSSVASESSTSFIASSVS